MMASMELSGELKAMAQLESALVSLTPEEQVRVLRWANERFGVRGANPFGDLGRANAEGEKRTLGASAKLEVKAEEYPEISDFFAATHPESEVDKALVVGYWFQYLQAHPDFDSQSINAELKHLGHQVGNITRAFDNLMSRKPQLVVQTKKTGSSKQGRKKYKLTAAGKSAVEKMLSANGESDL